MLKKKSLTQLVWLSLISCAVFLLLAQFASAINADKSSNASNTEPNSDPEVSADKKNASLGNTDLGINSTESIVNIPEPDSILPGDQNKNGQKINLVIYINVPHNKKAVDWCRIYPYPVDVPIKKNEITELPYKDKQIRSGLLAMAYWAKTRPDKIYPSGGWRMQYALAAAMAKSGLGLPHTLFTEYPWVENITPYIRKEVLAINAKEKERKNRYYQAKQVFIDYRNELETQALNKGLFPIDVPIVREIGGTRKGQASVDKAIWWVVAMHKIPGLKYYWLWPVKLNDNLQQAITLNEDNAIMIEGAW